jgi:cytochrome b561
MREFLLAMSGWLAATAFGTTLVVPWAVKAFRIHGRERCRFMALHFALGVAIPLIGLAHGVIPMSAMDISGLAKPGFTLGLSALLMLFAQIALGVSLRGAKTKQRQLRRAHLATMLALAGLIGMHIILIRA